jgi:hypothetical protein
MSPRWISRRTDIGDRLRYFAASFSLSAPTGDDVLFCVTIAGEWGQLNPAVEALRIQSGESKSLRTRYAGHLRHELDWLKTDTIQRAVKSQTERTACSRDVVALNFICQSPRADALKVRNEISRIGKSVESG